MPAYVVITKTRTRNQSELDLYAKEATAFMAGHTGTYLARFGSCEVKDGATVEGVAIIEFPQFQQAKAIVRTPCIPRSQPTSLRGGD